MSNDAGSVLRDLKEALRQPVPDTETLISHLSLALSAIHLHPTSVPPNQIPQSSSAAIHRYLPSIQISLLSQVLPNFDHALDEKELGLVDRFFCPSKTNDLGSLRLGRAVASVSYATLPGLLSASPGQPGLPIPCRDHVIRLLDQLTLYGVNDLYWCIWAGDSGAEGSKDAGLRGLKWEESIKAITSLPAKVANAVGRWKGEGWKGDVPASLVPRSYFTRLTIGYEALMYDLRDTPPSAERLQLVFQRMASIGLLSPASSVDIMRILIPRLLYHLHPPPPFSPYPAPYLPEIFLGLPASVITPLVSSLIANLPLYITHLTPDKPDGRIKQAAEVLVSIVGPPVIGNEVWDAVIRSATTQTSRADAQTRLIVAYIAPHAQEFIETILSTWTSPKHIKYALYTPQFQLTYTLLLAISLLPSLHPYLVNISTRPTFLTACQSYLSHPDGSVRRLGLLVAEILSELTIKEEADLEFDEKKETEELMQGLEVDEETGKPRRAPQAPKGARRLRFGGGMWDGHGEGREEARWLRSAVGLRDDTVGGGDWMLGWSLSESSELVIPPKSSAKANKPKEERGRTKTTKAKPPPKIVMLDEAQLTDPLQSYSPPHSPSSRSPSPTPSYLEEIAADPSLALDATQKKKVTRPVYILQLLQLLRTKDSPDAFEMAIEHGEGLIRAKREFGLELAENAIPLAGQLIGMSDQYKLDGWEERRQGMITALVACAPRQVAPFLAEQYFINQYSLQQKSTMLTALSMGARELAGLPIPDITTRRIDFPSKTLPPALHNRYTSAADVNHQIEAAAEGVRGILFDKGARRAAEVIPDIAREKRLRISSNKPGMAEVGSLKDRQLLAKQQPKPVVVFSEIAAEYFIMPLVNRFWVHFSDNHTREARAVAVGTRFRGAGAGLVMSPLALEKLLMTLSLLVHAARNSPLFLAVLAPEVVELGLTVGTRHPHRPETEEEEGDTSESQVIGGALELILVALDISGEVDGGRTILLNKPELVMAAGEWARGVFEVENEGGQVVGGQGGREGRIKGAAAGVVVRVGEMVERWGGRR